jgi:putative ABC transport system substrate-binding protein
MEYKVADGHLERLPTLASELVALKAAVIVAPTGVAAMAARKATNTVPIVFLSGTDILARSLVASFSRPEGNATGVNILTTQLTPKRLELLRELIPGASSAAFLINPDSVAAAPYVLGDARAAARAIGLDLRVLECRAAGDIDLAFDRIAEQRPDGLVVAPEALFLTRRSQLIALRRGTQFRRSMTGPSMRPAAGLSAWEPVSGTPSG